MLGTDLTVPSPLDNVRHTEFRQRYKPAAVVAILNGRRHRSRKLRAVKIEVAQLFCLSFPFKNEREFSDICKHFNGMKVWHSAMTRPAVEIPI
jgi:sporulation-control protein spo0M